MDTFRPECGPLENKISYNTLYTLTSGNDGDRNDILNIIRIKIDKIN